MSPLLDLILMGWGDDPDGPLGEPRAEELGRPHSLAHQGGGEKAWAAWAWVLWAHFSIYWWILRRRFFTLKAGLFHVRLDVKWQPLTETKHLSKVDKKVRIENYCSILGFLNLSILNRKNLLTAWMQHVNTFLLAASRFFELLLYLSGMWLCSCTWQWPCVLPTQALKAYPVQ